MNRRNGLFRLIVVSAALILPLGAARGETFIKQLANGVVYKQIIGRPSDPVSGTLPRIINVLTIDPKAPGVEIRAVLAHDRVNDLDPTRGREDMGSIARRLHAAAVVNTDFCNWTGDPLGLHVENGQLVSEPYPRRTMFGMTATGKYLYDVLGWDAKVTLPDGASRAINGLERDRGPGELIAYTRKWFTSTCTKDNGSEAVITTKDLPIRLGVPIRGTVSKLRPDLGDTPIPEDGIVLSGAGPAGDFVENALKEGMEVTLTFDVVPTATTGWNEVVQAAGGTPRLIRDGVIIEDFQQEGIGMGHITTAHPRTALGTTADGKLVLATVDGRQQNATGMPLPNLALLMKSLGCVDALSLDGGGSSTMATWFGILNSPSDGKLRPLPNGIAVFADEPSWPSVDFEISQVTKPVASAETVRLRLIDSATRQPLKKMLASRAIWSTDKGIGFVDQAGIFTGYKVGKVEVVVRLGSKFARTTIETVAGPPKRLTAVLEAVEPGKADLTVGVTDIGANGIAGLRPRVKISGGKLDAGEVVTGEIGKASVGVKWAGPSGGRIEVSYPGLTPVVVEQLSP
ncbi:MAG: phosphodiester glycosidase family protein [Armatimonadetes bacterium]|nr:phosphodiester glycosidase family protein [Armatimonadota bacterium]